MLTCTISSVAKEKTHEHNPNETIERETRPTNCTYYRQEWISTPLEVNKKVAVPLWDFDIDPLSTGSPSFRIMSFPNSPSPPRYRTHQFTQRNSISVAPTKMGYLTTRDSSCSRSRVSEIPLQAFMEFLAPPQPDFNIEAMMELKSDSEGILAASGRWTAYEKEPKDQVGKEDAII